MARLLLATSIAVIGASDDARHDRRRAVAHASPHDRRRRIYPVNPNHATVGGEPAFAAVTDIPDDVGLAVIAVPAAALAATIDAVHRRSASGARSSSPALDDVPEVDVTAIVANARRNGLRIIGPGSMGIASPRPDVALQAALVDVRAPARQRGDLDAVGHARQRRCCSWPDSCSCRLSWFVSLGDKSDVSGNDLLQFWEDDEATSVIAIYTESLGNPRKFARIARRVSLARPIVSVRTGTRARPANGDRRAVRPHRGDRGADRHGAARHGAHAVDATADGGRRVAVVSNSRARRCWPRRRSSRRARGRRPAMRR